MRRDQARCGVGAFGFKLTGEFGVVDEVCVDHLEQIRRSGTSTEEYPYGHPDFPLRDFTFDYDRIRAEYERLGLFNGYRICADPTDEKVEAGGPGGNLLILDLFRADNDWRARPGYRRRFRTYREFLEFYFDRFLAQMRKYPDTVWGDCIGEVDTGHPWPADFFRNKKEAYQHWKWSQMERPFGDDSGRDHQHIINYQLEHFRKRGIRLEHANLMIAGAMQFSCHYFFEWGFRLIWMETTCQQHHQDGIAFFRGAARQHGGLWGIDNASHHPHFNATTWYDAQGRQRRGYTPSVVLRNWMVSFLSGANILHQQASELSHFIYDRKGRFRLSEHGRNAKRFADFALRDHADRGETYVPVALFLNYHHGYSSRQGILDDRPNVWGGRLLFTNEDANITNFMDLFFPGHNRHLSICENVWNPAAPWRDQHEWAEMWEKGCDMRPFEEYCLTASPYGDSVDVILDNAELRTLRRYKIVVLAGPEELDGTQVERLLDYARAGGVIIASLAQIPGGMAQALGIVNQGGDWEYDLTTCVTDGQTFSGRRYGYARLRVRKGKALGRNHKNDVLLWEIPYGRGRVILSAVPYSQDCSGRELLPLCGHVYGAYIGRVLLAKAEPATLQLIVNQGPDFLLVAAFNNFRTPWRGTVAVRAPEQARIRGAPTDIWNRKPVRAADANTGTGMRLRLNLKPFDFAVVKIPLRRSRPRTPERR